MEAQSPSARILGAVTLRHGFVPDAACRAIFCDFLEEVAVRVEEKRKLWSEIVDIHSAAQRPFDILHAITQGERQFLNRCRTRFADVVSADGNRIELRCLFDRELECVNHTLYGWLMWVSVCCLR